MYKKYPEHQVFVFCFCFLKFSTWAKLNTLAGLYGPPGRMFDTPPGLTASSLVAMHAALLTINILVVFKAQSLRRNSSRPCRGRRPGFVQLGNHSHLLCVCGGVRGGYYLPCSLLDFPSVTLAAGKGPVFALVCCCLVFRLAEDRG